MLYIKKDGRTLLKVTLDTQDVAVTVWTIVFKNDITQVEQSITITPTLRSRFAEFYIDEPTDVDFGNNEGSYTYELKGDGVVYESGKARVYDGTLEAEGLFGDEVTYTEHDNTETNTQYITI